MKDILRSKGEKLVRAASYTLRLLNSIRPEITCFENKKLRWKHLEESYLQLFEQIKKLVLIPTGWVKLTPQKKLPSKSPALLGLKLDNCGSVSFYHT